MKRLRLAGFDPASSPGCDVTSLRPPGARIHDDHMLLRSPILAKSPVKSPQNEPLHFGRRPRCGQLRGIFVDPIVKHQQRNSMDQRFRSSRPTKGFAKSSNTIFFEVDTTQNVSVLESICPLLAIHFNEQQEKRKPKRPTIFR